MPSTHDRMTASLHPADVRPGDVLVPDGSALWRLIVDEVSRDDDGTWRFGGRLENILPGYPPRRGTVTAVPRAIVVEAALAGPWRLPERREPTWPPSWMPRRDRMDYWRGSDRDLYVYS